jgi:intracellular sulfur oxidation DsrE/DsrF family protein
MLIETCEARSMVRHYLCTALVALAMAPSVFAGPDDFHAGSVIKDFGRVAAVKGATALDENATFKVAFDISEAAKPGQISRRLESAARLINMHHAAGVPAANTQVAIVVHGGASKDLVNDKKYGDKNANAALVSALIDAGVHITLCGQTAAYYDIEVGDLLPGVTMGVSAMTAHALLQQAGYTLNPF